MFTESHTLSLFFTPCPHMQAARGGEVSMEDAEESAAGPEAMAAAEAAREAGMRARNQGRRNFNPRTMEALVEDMIEQAYAGDGLEVRCVFHHCQLQRLSVHDVEERMAPLAACVVPGCPQYLDAPWSP